MERGGYFSCRAQVTFVATGDLFAFVVFVSRFHYYDLPGRRRLASWKRTVSLRADPVGDLGYFFIWDIALQLCASLRSTAMSMCEMDGSAMESRTRVIRVESHVPVCGEGIILLYVWGRSLRAIVVSRALSP